MYIFNIKRTHGPYRRFTLYSFFSANSFEIEWYKAIQLQCMPFPFLNSVKSKRKRRTHYLTKQVITDNNLFSNSHLKAYSQSFSITGAVMILSTSNTRKNFPVSKPWNTDASLYRFMDDIFRNGTFACIHFRATRRA